MTTTLEAGGVSLANTNTNPNHPHPANPANSSSDGSQKQEIANGSKSDTTVGSNGNGKLTIDRANSIGWFFIESYYELYNKNTEQLYKLYNSDASISHGDIPELSKSLRQGNGTDSIKALFKDVSTSQVKNKIIIINADIQICMNNSILILVTGEWSKNGSSYYQFNQTFVLCRGINESTFDIANDILRFIDYEFKHSTLADKKPTKKIEESEQAPATEKIGTKENDKVEEEKEVENVKETEMEQPELKPEEEEKPLQEEADKETGNEAKPIQKETKPETETKSSDEAEISNGNEKEASANNRGGPISWAALAATAKEKSPSHTSAKPSPTSTKSPPKKATATTPTQQQATPLPNGKYKKEDWFPIYIRNCEDLTEKALKEHLTREFGEIKFLRQNMSIALCDFVDAEGQRKALDAKKAIIDGVEISLEIRESKISRKDSKTARLNDPKRKLDKKQQPPKKK